MLSTCALKNLNLFSNTCDDDYFCFCFFFFKQKTAYEIGLGIPAEPLFRSISITTILKRRGCLTVPRLTLMSLIKMMLVMVSVAAISKTFGLLRFLLRLSFLAK